MHNLYACSRKGYVSQLNHLQWIILPFSTDAECWNLQNIMEMYLPSSGDVRILIPGTEGRLEWEYD